MTFVSYSQNFEDVVLWRVFSDLKTGCYVDVGANDPNVFSVSRHFHDQGWRGVHVEPVPEYAKMLKKARPGDVVLEAAVSSKSGSQLLIDFPNTGLSTSDKDIAQRHMDSGFQSNEIEVRTLTLDEVFENVEGDVHWLKIDVEGAETDVLKSWTKSEVRPWILLIEATLPNSQVTSYESWEPIVLQKGYKFAYFDGLNRFYVHQCKEKIIPKLATPVNVFDKFELPLESAFTRGIAASHEALVNEHTDVRKWLQLQTQLFVEEGLVTLGESLRQSVASAVEVDRLAHKLAEVESKANTALESHRLHVAELEETIKTGTQRLSLCETEKAMSDEARIVLEQTLASLRSELNVASERLERITGHWSWKILRLLRRPFNSSRLNRNYE